MFLDRPKRDRAARLEPPKPRRRVAQTKSARRECRPDICAKTSAGWKLRRVRRSLVNGLVCKVVKSKTNSAALPQAATKPAERSSALLGIIEPEVLRSKEKAGTNPAGAEPAPAAVPGSASSNSAAAAGPPSSSFDIPNKSLGEIARAYRNEAATRMAINSEADLEQNRPNPKAEPVAPPSNSHTTPIAATVAQPRIRKGSQEFVFPIPPCPGRGIIWSSSTWPSRRPKEPTH